jgi:hypothetical protein
MEAPMQIFTKLPRPNERTSHTIAGLRLFSAVFLENSRILNFLSLGSFILFFHRRTFSHPSFSLKDTVGKYFKRFPKCIISNSKLS